MVHILKMGWGRTVCHLLPICCVKAKAAASQCIIYCTPVSTHSSASTFHIAHAGSMKRLPLSQILACNLPIFRVIDRSFLLHLSVYCREFLVTFQFLFSFIKFGINQQSWEKAKLGCFGANSDIILTMKQCLL